MKILIKNGRVIDPSQQLDKVVDIAIASGKIAHIDTIPNSFCAEHCIEANGLWVTPGWIDLCNRPGFMVEHEAQAAVQRGVTALCIPPDDFSTLPKNMSAAPIKLYEIAPLTQALESQKIADYQTFKESGCIALSQAQISLQNMALLRSCYEYASSLGMRVIVQPQELMWGNSGCAHEGVVSTRLGLPGIPYTVETIAVATHLALIEEADLTVHFTCLSSYRSVELIAAAKAKGLKVSADVAMHSLVLSEMDLLEFDANCHLYPPLRSQTDQLGLIHGVQNGVIDAICSDHRPLDRTAKLAPFAQTIPGLSAIDSFLSLGLYLVEKGKLDVFTLIRAVTTNPARIFDLSGGTLSIGQEANLCVIDPNYQWTLVPETMLSKGKNSPFVDWQLSGRVTHTVINGEIAFAI